MALGSPGACFAEKYLKIYIYTAVAILARFEQFLGKFCLNFWP